MSTKTTTIADLQEQADLDSAWRHFEEGTPFEPELARRIQERAERIRQETLTRVGTIDLETLLADDPA